MTTMTLTHHENEKIWVFKGGYETRAVPKEAGFRWNPEKKVWYTNDPNKAAKLHTIADPTCKTQLEQIRAHQEASFEQSRAASATIEVPKPNGLAYLPYQVAGIAYALGRQNTLIADQMGLGKTIQAIGYINAKDDISRVLIICPASLKINWQRECEKWLVRTYAVGITQPGGTFPTNPPENTIIIVNYDILKRYEQEIRATHWDLLVIDECHMLKNGATLRCRQVFGYTPRKSKDPEKQEETILPIPAKHTLALTGTPITNRPVELWPIVSNLDKVGWPSYWGFVRRYCDAKQNKYGWDVKGASNLEEMQERLRSTCFPYETVVSSPEGDRPIGEIVENKENIYVYAYNKSSSRVERRKIVAHNKRLAPNKMVRIVHELGQFSCTPDHKIWTEKGYIRADSLNVGVCLSALQNDAYNPSTRKTKQCEILLNTMRRNAQRKNGQSAAESNNYKISQAHRGGSKNMPRVWTCLLSPTRKEGGQLCMEPKTILLPILFSQVEDSRKHKPDTIPFQTTQNYKEISRGPQATSGNAQRKKANQRTVSQAFRIAKKTMGKNSHSETYQESVENLQTSTITAYGIGMERRLAGSAHNDQTTKREIQERGTIFSCCGLVTPANKNSNRNRWTFAHIVQTNSKRQMERKNITKSRILRVEILESRNRQQSRSGSKSDYVYDIEVEEDHNYFANNVLVSNCMLRRIKSEVLKELPPKFRQVIEIAPDKSQQSAITNENAAYTVMQSRIAHLRAQVALSEASDDPEKHAQAVMRLKEALSAEFTDMARLRKETGERKVFSVAAHLIDCLENSEKIVVFAQHHSCIDHLMKELAQQNPVKVDGRDSLDVRQAAVDAFQNDESVKIFVGQIQAAGVGLTLTKASHVVFAELDWTPGNISQCEDRCIAEGQPVLTPTGWIPIESIKTGDQVITRDGSVGTVTDTWNRGATKTMAEIIVTGWTGPLVTTRDHRILLANGEWCEAGQLEPGDIIAMPSGHQNSPSPKNITFDADCRVARTFVGVGGLQTNGRLIKAPESFPLDKETLFVFGYFAGDGFSSTAKNKGRFISFAGNGTTKLESLARVQKWLEGHCIHYHIRIKGEGREIRGYSAELAYWFRKQFGHGSHNKHLPGILLGLDVNQSKWLLSGLLSSDGYIRKGYAEYITSSEHLAAQVFLLVLRCGYKPTVRKNTTGQHVIGFALSSRGISGQVREVKLRFPKKINGKRERVYDLTVDKDPSFVVGTSVVHNCHRIGQTNNVLVQHIVLSGSLDAKMARTLVQKQTIIDASLDNNITPESFDVESLIEAMETPKPQTEREMTLQEIMLTLSTYRIDAIHDALKQLASMCDGALQLDGRGFSAVDVEIGHSLAAWNKLTPKQAALGLRIVRKYSRQLDEELVNKCEGKQ